MRKFFVLPVIIVFLFSCNSGKDQSGTMLTGTADGASEPMFVLGGPGGSRDTVKLNDDNTFEYPFDSLDEPGNFYILAGDDAFAFYVRPGDQLDVYFDVNDLTASINFGGEFANINNYLADKNRELGEDRSNREIFMQQPENFMKWADSTRQVKETFLEEYPKDDPADRFWKTEEAELLYGWVHNYRMYPMYNKYYNEGVEPELPDGFEEIGKDMDVNKPEYLGSSSFFSYVTQRVNSYVQEQTEGQEDVNRSLAKLQLAGDIIKDPKVLTHYLRETVEGRMQWAELKDIEDEINFFLDNCQDTVILADFNEQLDAWKRLDEGQPAFDFSGKDLEGNTVKLSDFSGKYVYVDVWATWCGPCKYEIPFLKELEAEYHDRNIVFLSYSIDEDKDAWLKFVPENELKGVQIIGEAAWQSQLVNNYKIRGVPTFMFFGPDGKIISVKMTRPSNQATRDRFDSYQDL